MASDRAANNPPYKTKTMKRNTYLTGISLIATLVLTPGCIVETSDSDRDRHRDHSRGDHYDRASQSDYRNRDNRHRTPHVNALNNGNYLVTYSGGGSAAYDKHGKLMSSSGLSSSELRSAQSAVDAKRRSNRR